jgi:thiamine biosynthesis lipoprotein
MKATRIIMGMPVILQVVDTHITESVLEEVFAYFVTIDERFSTYKATSEISAINHGTLDILHSSYDMKKVFMLSEETKKLTRGYFDIRRPDGIIDPSGLVKGWAIFNAAELLRFHGMKNFCVEIAGDMEVEGHNEKGEPWQIGIQNPFSILRDSVKVLSVTHGGVATSGTYVRGDHIYNPHKEGECPQDIVSLTVVGPNIYDADRFATAAFAMGEKGITFIEQLEGFEGYVIDRAGVATMTSGFEVYTT